VSQTLIRRILNKIFLSKKGKWDYEYSHGVWDFLDSELEKERLKVLSKALEGCGKNQELLEIGCGEGILLQFLPPDSFKKYWGLDISDWAIQKAKAKQFPRTEFISGDMENFIPQPNMDTILFNESIYYSKNPILLFNRYLKNLKPGGRILTSIYENPQHLEWIGQFQKIQRPIQSWSVENEKGRWKIDLYLKG